VTPEMAAAIRSKMAYERARVAPPDGFPKLPDIPLGRYTDPALYELELERVFKRSWLYAGHVIEFAEPGAYRLVDIPLAPILVVRGRDGVLRGFMNACRHRGAPVVRDDEGVARLLVCQYHSWAYDLDGRLHSVPDERDFVGLCHEDRALTDVRCESWGGFVFVNLDPEAPSLAEWIAPLASRLPEIADAPLRVISKKSYDIACNWKVMAEGFLEVYHAKTIHRSTVAETLDGSGAVMELYPNGHTGMITPYHDRVIAAGREHVAGLPRIDGIDPLFWTSNPAYGMFPNLITPLEAAGFPFLLFWPIAINRTRLDVMWFAVDWGDGDRPEKWERRLAGFDVVMDEDMKNLAPIQRSIEAAAHAGIPLNYQERRIWHVHSAIDTMIGPANIPVELRVPDLLRDWVEP
jgi:phenylpropionate dioxygenase-like ring-hydroxylating dioxygenase large terminal subunit